MKGYWLRTGHVLTAGFQEPNTAYRQYTPGTPGDHAEGFMANGRAASSRCFSSPHVLLSLALCSTCGSTVSPLALPCPVLCFKFCCPHNQTNTPAGLLLGGVKWLYQYNTQQSKHKNHNSRRRTIDGTPTTPVITYVSRCTTSALK